MSGSSTNGLSGNSATGSTTSSLAADTSTTTPTATATDASITTGSIAKKTFDALADVTVTTKTLKGHQVLEEHIKKTGPTIPWLQRFGDRVKHFFTFEFGFKPPSPEKWEKDPIQSEIETNFIAKQLEVQEILTKLKGKIPTNNDIGHLSVLVTDLDTMDGDSKRDLREKFGLKEKEATALKNSPEFQKFAEDYLKFIDSNFYDQRKDGWQAKAATGAVKLLEKAEKKVQKSLDDKTSWSRESLDTRAFTGSGWAGPVYPMVQEYSHKNKGEKIKEAPITSLREGGTQSFIRLQENLGDLRKQLTERKAKIDASTNSPETKKILVSEQIEGLRAYNAVLDKMLSINQNQIAHWEQGAGESAFIRELGLAHQQQAHIWREKQEVLSALSNLTATEPEQVVASTAPVPAVGPSAAEQPPPAEEPKPTGTLHAAPQEFVRLAEGQLTHILRVCNSSLRLGADSNKLDELKSKFNQLAKEMEFSFSYEQLKEEASSNPELFLAHLKEFQAGIETVRPESIPSLSKFSAAQLNASIDGNKNKTAPVANEIKNYIEPIEKSIAEQEPTAKLVAKSPRSASPASAASPVTPTAEPVTSTPESPVDMATEHTPAAVALKPAVPEMNQEEKEYLKSKKDAITRELGTIDTALSKEKITVKAKQMLEMRKVILEDNQEGIEKAEEYRNAFGGHIKDHVELAEAKSEYFRELKKAEDWSTHAGEAGIWRQPKIILQLKTERGVFTDDDYKKGTEVTHQVEYRKDQDAYLQAGHYHLEAAMVFSGIRKESALQLQENTGEIKEVKRKENSTLAKGAMTEALKFYQKALETDTRGADYKEAIQTLAQLYYRGVPGAGQVLLDHIEKQGGKLSREEYRFLVFIRNQDQSQNPGEQAHAMSCLSKFATKYPEIEQKYITELKQGDTRFAPKTVFDDITSSFSHTSDDIGGSPSPLLWRSRMT